MQCPRPLNLFTRPPRHSNSLAARMRIWCDQMGIKSCLQCAMVFVWGWSMALGGFLLSVSASLIIHLLPLLRPQMPDEAYDNAHRRAYLPPQHEHPEHDPSDTCSADSLQSFNSGTSEPLTSRRPPSTPPTSLGNSPESPSQALPPASLVLHGKSGRLCTSIPQHVCTPEKCSNNASSSGHASSSPVAHENPENFAKDGINEGENTSKMMKSTRPICSWLKSSHSNASSESQRTPRSSGECSRTPSITTPHSVTFNEDVLSSMPSKKREPRRASTLLPFRRFSKARSRPETEDGPSSFAALGMTPTPSEAPEGTKSAPSSPAPILSELPDLTNTEVIAREQKRRVSYFSRLKRRGSGKEKPAVVHDEPVSDVKEPDKLSQESHKSKSGGRGRTREKRSSLRLCDKRRRPATASAAPPLRTNPYEAPYFFPTPLSPDVADYVRLARTEVRRTSISPSAAVRIPMRRNSAHQSYTETTLNLSPTPTRSSSGRQKRSSAIVASSSPTEVVPQSAPPKRSSFHAGLLDRHRKSASVSETPAISEFGVLQHHGSPTDSRG